MTKAPALLLLAGFIMVVVGMKAVGSILALFFLAVFIAIMCTPPLLWLQCKGVPKVQALVLLLAAILVTGLLVGTLLGPLPNHFLNSLSDRRERLSAHKAGNLKSALIFYKKR